MWMIKSSLKNISDLGICQAKKIGIFRGLMVLERNRAIGTGRIYQRCGKPLGSSLAARSAAGLVSVLGQEVNVPILFALAGVERCRVYNVSRMNSSASYRLRPMECRKGISPKSAWKILQTPISVFLKTRIRR